MFGIVRDYGLPVLLALVVHAAVAAALWHGWSPDRKPDRVMKPRIVQASLRVLEPPKQPKARAPKPAPQPKKVAPPPPKAQPKPTPKIAEKPPEPKVDEEAERRRREEAARAERLRKLEQAAFEQALLSEAFDIADDAQEEAAMSYIDGIYKSVVANWSRPPSARNDMQAKLAVELIPTGEVIGVSLLESSGSTAFDRSAEAAVRKARRFDVPQDNAQFERHFRRFTLLFKPEDLLR